MYRISDKYISIQTIHTSKKTFVLTSINGSLSFPFTAITKTEQNNSSDNKNYDRHKDIHCVWYFFRVFKLLKCITKLY